MSILVFNLPGLAFALIGFVFALLVGEMANIHSEGGTMMIAGLIIIVCDLTFRLLRKEGHWFWPSKGGSLFFMPVWFLGVVWSVLGAVYLHQGKSDDHQASSYSVSQTWPVNPLPSPASLRSS